MHQPFPDAMEQLMDVRCSTTMFMRVRMSKPGEVDSILFKFKVLDDIY